MIAEVIDEPLVRGLRPAVVEPESWRELDACPVCGASEHLRDVGAVEAKRPGSIVSVCTDCHHGFRRRRPSVDWFDRYYAHGWDAPGQEAAARGAIAVVPKGKVVDFCAGHLPERSRVLDMGAGFGADLLGFRERGHEVFGIERSEHRARHIAEALGIPCDTSAFESASLPEGLGLIYSNHVMEHVDDPATVVAAAAAALEPGAMLYTAVPNWLDEYPPQWFHFVPHLSAFSLRSLSRLLATQGLKVVKSQVDRELQVLATKLAGPLAFEPDPDPEAARAECAELTAERVAGAFGRDAGPRAVAWWKTKTREESYTGRPLPGGRAAYASLRAARSAYARLPANARRRSARLLPPYVTKKGLRMIHVRAEGEFELPVRVRYEAEDAPVWVK